VRRVLSQLKKRLEAPLDGSASTGSLSSYEHRIVRVLFEALTDDLDFPYEDCQTHVDL